MAQLWTSVCNKFKIRAISTGIESQPGLLALVSFPLQREELSDLVLNVPRSIMIIITTTKKTKKKIL